LAIQFSLLVTAVPSGIALIFLGAIAAFGCRAIEKSRFCEHQKTFFRHYRWRCISGVLPGKQKSQRCSNCTLPDQCLVSGSVAS
jgi:hypothetical protein